MLRRPERRRRLGRVLALAIAVLAIGAPTAPASAADDEGEWPGQLHVVRVDNQTLIVDEVGNAILYTDPTPADVLCEELEACWQVDAPAGADVVIAGGGNVIGVVDGASGEVLEEGTAPP